MGGQLFLRLALAGLPLIGIAARAEPPPALVEEAEEAFAICGDLGGSARILDGYRTEADLNGDGVADYVTDLRRIECAAAGRAFCDSAGCPVAVWLSEPDGRYSRLDLGPLQGFEILLGSGGELPVLRANHNRALCGGAQPCTRSWVFADNAPETPPFDVVAPPRERQAAAVAAEDAPEPEPSILPEAAPPAAEPVAPGWTLRRVPGSSPVALGGGTGRVASLAAFCLQGVPFLAVHFAEPPEDEALVLDFAFSQGDVAVEAGREATAGGAYVLALDAGVLASRLAGRDSAVVLRAGGIDEGTLSLSGSTDAIRAALSECLDR